jgi:hypothetical protein
MREHETEPVPGLPESLPRGERILWQGSPDWKALARHGFHLRLLALYFLALAVWSAAELAAVGATPGAMLGGAVWLIVLGVVPVVLVTLFAWGSARTTLYTVTDRRLVLRVGVALPLTVNLPLSAIASATMRRYASGGGDIILAMEGRHRVSYVAIWPHLRGLRFLQPQPMLRAVPDVEAAAQALANALASSLPGETGQRVTLAPTPRPAAASGANHPIPA